MRPYQFGSVEAVRELTLEAFGGADFGTHPSKVTLSRSPDMKNMLAQETHFLVKRPGYKRVANMEGKLYGMFPLPDRSGDMLCHAGATLALLKADGTSTTLLSSMAQEYSAAFTMGGKLYLLDGATYRVVQKTGETWTVSAVTEKAFVPTTTISAPPTGGGTPLEPVNLLTPKRINTFIGNGSATQFRLDAQNIDATAVTATVNGTAVTVSSVDRATGVVTLASPPANGAGTANVTVTFCKTVGGYASKINRCRIAGLYGGKNDTRVFLSGNPSEPASDWQSGLYDPTYFPDTGYTRIGTDATAILGYVKQYENQIVIKEGGAQESSQYLRSYLMADDGSAMYPLKQGAQGVGAVSRRGFGSLGDLPLFVSETGVMGVFGTAVYEQRSIRGVSSAIDARLTQENDLKNACAVVFEDRYYLACGGSCYVADGRIIDGSGAPEWYYWDNIPATCFAAMGGALYFGTEDGRVCRFCKTGEADVYLDDGKAIDAYWCTPVLSLGSWSSFKSVRAFYPVLMPSTRSSVSVRYITDGHETEVFRANLDLFDFSSLDFGRLSFRGIPGASPFLVRYKLSRCNTVQMRIGNDKPGEAFGLLALVLRYTQGQSVK